MSRHPVSDFEVDEGFQGLKLREVNDSRHPHELQFQSTALKHPNTAGWNVQSAAEVSPDGRAYRTETVATTDGVEHIDGGKAEFQGFNEQKSSGFEQGDDKNFIKQSMESSKTHLKEKFVSGDANSDHLEVRTSSSTQSSSSKVVQSSSTLECDDNYVLPNQKLLKNTYQNNNQYDRQYIPDDHYLEKVQQHEEYYNKQNRKQSLNSEEVQTKATQYNEKVENKSSMRNIETEQTLEKQKRYIDMDKASPEYQKHVQYLMSQPGEIISNTVEYPKPNVKMITTVKRLPDGTIVRNKRYETEEENPSRPVSENLHAVSNVRKVHNQQINDQKTKMKTKEENLLSNQRRYSHDDYVVQDIHSNEITNVKVSSTKQSNEKYVTDSTSKIIHEYDEANFEQTPKSSPQRSAHDTADNYPSYNQKKPVLYSEPSKYSSTTPQPYDSNRSQSIENVPSAHVYEKRMPSDEGEILFVTEKKQNVKTQSSSQRTTETKIVSDDIIRNEQYPQMRGGSPRKVSDDFSPGKKPLYKQYEEPHNVNAFPEETQSKVPSEQFPEWRKTPNVEIHNQPVHVIENIERTAAHKAIENRHFSNKEFVMLSDNTQARAPQKPENYYTPSANQRNMPDLTRKEVTPQTEPIPSCNAVLEPSNKKGSADFSTQGFPSQVKPSAPSNAFIEPVNNKNTPDFTTHGFPSQKKPTTPENYPNNTFQGSLNKQDITHLTNSSITTYKKDDTHKKPSDKDYFPDFTSHGFPSQARPTTILKNPDNAYVEPFKQTPDTYLKHSGSTLEPVKENNQEFQEENLLPSTQRSDDLKEPKNYKSEESPHLTYDEPLEGKNKRPISTQGYPSQIKPSSTIKKPISSTAEVTQKIIKKEREVDAAHRAFASSLRSSSPIDSRPDSYMDTQRHTPRSSVSSNKTFKRDMRETSHDSSAPSETSRNSTNTITKRIPSKTLQSKQTVPSTNKNFNSYEVNKRNTKSPVTRNVTSPQTIRTPLGGTVLRESFKSDNQNTKLVDNIFSINAPLTTRLSKTTISENNASHLPNGIVEEPCIKKSFYLLGPTDELTLKKTDEPSNSPASSRKDYTNFKHIIPFDDTYQPRFNNQQLVESSQSMRNNERKTVSTETTLTMNNDIEHDQRSIILPGMSPQEVVEDIEAVDAFWRKPKKLNEKPDSQNKETVTQRVESISTKQRRASDESKKTPTNLIGAKNITNERILKTKLSKEPSRKDSLPSKRVHDINVRDDVFLSDKSQINPEIRKTSPSIISEKTQLTTISKVQNTYDSQYMQESNYDDDDISNAKQCNDNTNMRKQPKVTDYNMSSNKIHAKNDKPSRDNRILPQTVANKKQHKAQEPVKSPTRNVPKETDVLNSKNIDQTLSTKPIHPQKTIKESRTKHNDLTKKIQSPEPKTKTFQSTERKTISKSPTHKSSSPEPKVNFESTPTVGATTHQSNVKNLKAQYELQPIKSGKSPTRISKSPEPQGNFNTCTYTTYVEPEVGDKLEPTKSRKSISPEPKDNFRTNDLTTTYKTGDHHLGPRNEFQPMLTNKSPARKSVSPEPKVNFERNGHTVATITHYSNVENLKAQFEFQPIKSIEFPIRKSKSPERQVNFETCISTTHMEPKIDNTFQPTDPRKSISPEPEDNFRTNISTTTYKPEDHQSGSKTEFQPILSNKLPKSKSPEPKPNFRTNVSTSTPTHKSDTQHPEERLEFEPMTSKGSPTHKPEIQQSKHNFREPTSTSSTATKPFETRPELKHTQPEKPLISKIETQENNTSFRATVSTSSTTTHKLSTEKLEIQNEFLPIKSQKSPSRTLETQHEIHTFEEHPELQSTKPRKSPTPKSQPSESKINFGTTVSTRKIDKEEPKEKLQFQSSKSPKPSTRRLEPKTSNENSNDIVKTDAHKFHSDKLQPIKSPNAPQYSYESVESINQSTNSVESKTYAITTDMHENIYEEIDVEPTTDIQRFPSRESPTFNSKTHFESSHISRAEKFVAKEKEGTSPHFQKSPSPVSSDTFSQKIDSFNRNDVPEKKSTALINSKDGEKYSPLNYENVHFEHIKKNMKQSSLTQFVEDDQYEMLETDEELSKLNEDTSFHIDDSVNSNAEQAPTKSYNSSNKKIPSETLVSTSTQNVNTRLIESEKENTIQTELFDGTCISKTPVTTSPTLPNYGKKGVSPRETFEERCREILGMEDYGSTHGTFKKQTKPDKISKVEDVDVEISSNYINKTDSVKNKKTGKTTNNGLSNTRKPYSAPLEKFVEPEYKNIRNKERSYTKDQEVNDKLSYTTEEPDNRTSHMYVSPTTTKREHTTIVNRISTNGDTLIDDESFPDVDQTLCQQIKTTRRLEEPQSINEYHNISEYSQTKKNSVKKVQPKTQKESPQVFPNSKDIPYARKSRKSPSTSIDNKTKLLLDKSTVLPNQNVMRNSSSETSPSRFTDQRRSSTISVNTEIVIDHMSPQPEEIIKIPSKTTKSKRKSISTERKDSAPVPRVTRNMKDATVSRSISENIIKTKGKPKQGTHAPSERHPKKCFATKTINLTVKDGVDRENVIIDIQHAKSSREVSPNKIVPTPVPADLFIDHLRYPDLVQEPEDEPQRKPFEKNIPIFEEESNEYLGCKISEIYNENTTVMEENTYNISNEQANMSDVRVTDDECLLSVQEKVSKFTKSADEVTKPKSSSPFNRDFDTNARVPEDDECLLTINEKVNKFQKNTTNVNQIQQDAIASKNLLNAPTKLRPSAPQKSPDLVRSISKQMSTFQVENQPDENDNIPFYQVEDNDNEIMPHTPNHTNLLEMRRQKDILSRPSAFSKHTLNSNTTVTENQKHKYRRMSNDFEETSKQVKMSKYAEVDNIRIDRPAQKLPLTKTDAARTNPQIALDNNNTQFSVVSQEKQHFVEHSRPFDQPITNHNNDFEKEPITVSANIRSPIKKITESTMTNKTHVKSFSSDDQVKKVSAKPKATVQTSTKLIAARRNIFEKDDNNNKQKPLESKTTVFTGRRPSYMDHTKCSLEHIRRDSLEINKSNYLRKVSREDEGQTDRVTSVKFDVPKKIRTEEPINSENEINIEEIYDIEVLEQMLQTVTSYELRRRMRAQIRRIKNEISLSNTEVDGSLKKRPGDTEYKINDDHLRRNTNEIVISSDNEESMHIYTKNKRASISPERSSNSYDKILYTDKYPKGSSKQQPNRNIIDKKPLTTTTKKTHQSTFKMSDMKNSYNIKHSDNQEPDKSNTFRRNSVDRKTFTKATNDVKKQYDNIPKGSSPEFKSYNPRLHNRSPSPNVTSHSRVISEYTVTKHLPEDCTDNTEYIVTQDLESERRDSVKRGRNISPKLKTPDQVGSTIFEVRTSEKTLQSNMPQEQRQPTTKDERCNFQQSVHTKIVDNARNIHNIKERSAVKVEQKRKSITETPIWANRNNVLRSSAIRQSSNVESQSKKTKFSTVRKELKDVNKKSTIEQDSVVSSYGIGPTDENGEPIFGVKALRKKPGTSNVTENITGCVIEEKYYSDNKSKPIVQRKETYYSTNPNQLKEIGGKSEIKQLTDKDTELYILSKTDQKSNKNILKSSSNALHHDDDYDYLIDGGIKQKNIINKSAWRMDDSTDGYDVSSNAEILQRTHTEHYSDAEEEFENYRSIAQKEMSETRRVYSTSTRSFTNLPSDGKKINDVNDVLQLMRNADHVVEEGDTTETQEARALLNKFIGASVIMNGAEAALPSNISLQTAFNNNQNQLKQQEVKITRNTKTTNRGNSSSIVTNTTTYDLQEIWDEQFLKQLLDQAKTYEERRKIRARLRELMAEREESNIKRSLTTHIDIFDEEDSGSSIYEDTVDEFEKIDLNRNDYVLTKDTIELQLNCNTICPRQEIDRKIIQDKIANSTKEDNQEEQQEQQEVTTTTEKVQGQSKDGTMITTTTKVTTRSVTGGSSNKPVSAFTKFKQLDAKSSQQQQQQQQQHSKLPKTSLSQSRRDPNASTSASTSSTTFGNSSLVQFVDPALNARAATVKEQLLQWCQSKTAEYENIKITNFSTSWSNGLAFCALIHHFLPNAFDYNELTAENRRKNFEIAFTVADEKAGIAPLLDVDDMVAMKCPDWKCVFVYVQSIYRHFRNLQ